MMQRCKLFVAALFLASAASSTAFNNQTLYNPMLPGWHSDPSCVFVPERDNSTFCTSSTFLLTPGLPVHVSKDLANWKLASHALSRKSQYPEFDQSVAQSDGIWAATIRYHQGIFYIITIYRNNLLTTGQNVILIFKSKDPYNDEAWSDPVRYISDYIDPDLFWDDDGTAYVATSGTYLQTINLETGVFGEPRSIWNGSTGEFLEGPHIYKKDGYYYLLVAEGGSGLNHTVTIARSSDIWGPYEGNPANPILTNVGTSEYFQNIGHADLFQDAKGQWWAVALAWRSGPDAQTYPMGRETVLTAATWEEGEWPVVSPVRGVENGWYREPSTDIPGRGGYTYEPDVVDFDPESTIPSHFGYWRWPQQGSYTVSPPGHSGSLQLIPSNASITAGHDDEEAGYILANYTFIGRVQTDTLFQFSTDISFDPTVMEEEAGVAVFLNQLQNIALGIVMLPVTNSTSNTTLAPHFRFIISGIPSQEKDIPPPHVTPIPHSWLQSPIRLMIRAENETHYTFSGISSVHPHEAVTLGTAPATVVSGGVGDFTGSLVGVYATTNGGNGSASAYVSRWRYQGLAQAVDHRVFIPSRFPYDMDEAL
ncbi:hypothetical protein AA0112_g12701 [Alternaria arborescens]|uniref:Beta-xylosidase C-terminal Concanavalin A-like domain-containing protein n=1 Tax=Alternaria tenuissima TaxID=119927 RepID=A0ABY0FNY1_9PLEO|nr:hypothetical protein AA0112_g12701 [Alternaria arborescens]RYN85184.1 hypothetical protein AA0119_g13326 [Alternaria tenuissima]RYO07671.1 hypothetical protein AA0121_g11642 [Alternaria tenuissima]RYO63865.1 hypothetical protein AA0116_g3025 [Alternaria tenuissima]